MLFELIATSCTTIFAGAPIYINVVEHPARIAFGIGIVVREWRPGYKRATVVQASLAAVIPFTLIVVYPTNRLPRIPELDLGGLSTATLCSRWNRLRAVRTPASVV
jgi:hypothetical protein